MKTPRLFQDHMVIQRNNPFFIWGTGENGEHVRAEFGTEIRETIVKEGKKQSASDWLWRRRKACMV